jgi:hypothetical protein
MSKLVTREQKDRANANLRAARKKYPERFKGYDLKKTFGITTAQYKGMLKAQKGVCAICGNPEEAKRHKNQRLAVDHCHTTGKIRGLLCSQCNHGLGSFRDNPDFLAKAISYVMK